MLQPHWTRRKGPVQTLLLADDDPLWLLACSHEDIIELIRHPFQWVSEVNEELKAPVPIKLSNEFLIQMSLQETPKVPESAQVEDLLAEKALFDDTGKEFIVQGISGTGVLLIRRMNPRLRSAKNDERDQRWTSYWDEWSGEASGLSVAKAHHFGVGFGHMELSNDKTLAYDRADRIAAFLTWSADPERTFEIQRGRHVPYINRILRSTPAVLHDIHGSDTQGRNVNVIQKPEPQFRELTASDVEKINFSFVGREEDFHAPATDNDPVETACDDMHGTLQLTYINVNGMMVKAYRPIEKEILPKNLLDGFWFGPQ